MVNFELPWIFLALPLPLLIYWLTPEYKDQGETLRAPFFDRIVHLTGHQPTPGAVVLKKNRFQRSWGLITWFLIITALAKPVWSGEPIVRETSARDLLLVVDLSGSMSANDFTGPDGSTITRLDAVKMVLYDFISRRKHDRLGLAVFGSNAFPQAPFTEDHNTVNQLLDELQVNMAGPKTMIGDAIGLAIRLFDASKSKSKVLLLLTDGNDSGSQMPLAQAAKIASEKGLIIHTIAIGDPETVGEQALDTIALKQISEKTNGKFFLALNREALENVYTELDKIESEKVETLSFRPKHSLFHVPLGLALLSNIFLIGAHLVQARTKVKVTNA